MEMYINWLRISSSFLVLSKKKKREGCKLELICFQQSGNLQIGFPQLCPVLWHLHLKLQCPVLSWGAGSAVGFLPPFCEGKRDHQPCGEALSTWLSNAFSGFRTNSSTRGRKIFKLKRIECEPWLIKTCPLGKGFQTAIFSKMRGVAGRVFLFGLDFDCSLYQPFGCSNSWKVMVATVRLEGRTVDYYIRSSCKRN